MPQAYHPNDEPRGTAERTFNAILSVPSPHLAVAKGVKVFKNSKFVKNFERAKPLNNVTEIDQNVASAAVNAGVRSSDDFGSAVRATDDMFPCFSMIIKPIPIYRKILNFVFPTAYASPCDYDTLSKALQNINWKSVPRFGHTFLRHGEGAKVTKKLKDRARTHGNQGQ